MRTLTNSKGSTECKACQQGVKQPFAFSMAFQPIIDVEARQVFAYEALVRGVNGESAQSVLNQVTPETRYAFDQNCRVVALTLASKLGLAATGARLSINFMPGAVYSPAACIQLTLKSAKLVGIPLDRLIFEITEGEEVVDRQHLRSIIEEYQRQGFAVAVDDFGAGHSGMNLLADLPANIIKLDMALTRQLQERPAAIAVVRAMVVLIEERPSRNLICSRSPLALRQSVAQVGGRSCGPKLETPISAAAARTTSQTAELLSASPILSPPLRIERNSLPSSIPAAAIQVFIACLTQSGTATVRTRPPFPTRSANTQRFSLSWMVST